MSVRAHKNNYQSDVNRVHALADQTNSRLFDLNSNKFSARAAKNSSIKVFYSFLKNTRQLFFLRFLKRDTAAPWAGYIDILYAKMFIVFFETNNVFFQLELYLKNM